MGRAEKDQEKMRKEGTRGDKSKHNKTNNMNALLHSLYPVPRKGKKINTML